MALQRRNYFVYGLLLAVWAFIVIWQIAEHRRVKEVARMGLRNRAQDIADTISAAIRGMQFRSVVFEDRLAPVLAELVNERTNRLVRSRELVWIALVNETGDLLVSAGKPVIELRPDLVLPEGGLWGDNTVTLEFVIAGVANSPAVVPPRRDPPTGPPPPEPPPRRPPERLDQERPDEDQQDDADRRDRRDRRRPFWARDWDPEEFQAMLQRRELHGLLLTMSTSGYQGLVNNDLWLRLVIIFFSSISAVGVAVAWRNLAKSSMLQLRLVRASELNTHLREMNLAAAGLAHETRNPLNIIRGMAQLIARKPDASPEIREQSKAIVEETDKITAQLNEFINYSRPREVRPTVLALNSVIHEVVRALSYDIEEKKIQLAVKGDAVSIEADEQMLRQALFNLVLNATQMLEENGVIEICAQRQSATEATLEVRDNGPGVSPENRTEVFKPYFTTQPKGTGLGLAIVQQIVLAHGWEIECAENQPKGAVFRIRHLKIASRTA
ncbi:MAG TPA: hypothetical protein GYA07_02935 [Verrucomicrobia bacterium]|nr:hypothetical protein [Verrucomicrobiota bacterium]HOP97612.1 ATP-binding protein [Verrucomicrobiota bacterium]